MRSFLFTLFITTGLVHLVNGQSDYKTPPDPIQVPKVSLVYVKTGPFDRVCGSSLNKSVKQEDMDELSGRLGEFQAIWDKEGSIYLQTVLKETGRSFPWQDVEATLTACDFPSMGSPLIIYTKSFLSSAPKPHPVSVFPIVVFHELMHIFLRAVNDSSLLKKKYVLESPFTLGQLQVMALEKFVLLKLGRLDIIKWLDTRYRTRFSPEHRRAWEIVNDIEGCEAFIEELKIK
ncbi:hypothetical protein HB364_07135 [Pseudoflavitalea sp. X16]|uniref:hypothetical protein n=1 Tax=Paraflavitalea devenefica TaxID=2716334 RepID=UPI0014237334|nr:hypothetical protein [Paraflavitalea devenefica]NII24844.1 hypothetical protein [Paraflavitalea devenefica]